MFRWRARQSNCHKTSEESVHSPFIIAIDVRPVNPNRGFGLHFQGADRRNDLLLEMRDALHDTHVHRAFVNDPLLDSLHL